MCVNQDPEINAIVRQRHILLILILCEIVWMLHINTVIGLLFGGPKKVYNLCDNHMSLPKRIDNIYQLSRKI